MSSSSWVVIFKRARSPADIRTQQNVVLKTPVNIIMYHSNSCQSLSVSTFLSLFVFVLSRSVSAVALNIALSVCLLQLFPLNSYWFFGLTSRSHWLE